MRAIWQSARDSRQSHGAFRELRRLLRGPRRVLGNYTAFWEALVRPRKLPGVLRWLLGDSGWPGHLDDGSGTGWFHRTLVSQARNKRECHRVDRVGSVH
jgi:hypothetical protein